MRGDFSLPVMIRHCLENVVDHLNRSRLVVMIDQEINSFLATKWFLCKISKPLPVPLAGEIGQDIVIGK